MNNCDEVRIGIGELTKREIQEIEMALHLFRTGQYGNCTVCKRKIGPVRPELLLHTLTCIQTGGFHQTPHAIDTYDTLS